MITSSQLNRTPLFDLQLEVGGRMVDFHGWEMPVQFSGILAEHQAVRSACGVFDVSHMGQITVSGPDALAFLNRVQCNRIAPEPGRGTYSHLLNNEGGILDDTISYALAPDRFYVVVNAAAVDADVAWLNRQAAGFDVKVDNVSDWFGMLAVQGPKAPALIEDLFPGALEIPRFGIREMSYGGEAAVLMRTGYTGEDGFEVALPTGVVCDLWRDLMKKGPPYGLLPCGLGSRDTLRLEAGYLLVGTDTDETRTPYEAGCGWVVKSDKGDFIGREALMRRKEEGFAEYLTGIRLSERGVPRTGCSVWHENIRVGELSSATFSPSLKTGIGVGYLSKDVRAPQISVEIEVHGRRIAAETVRLPFRQNAV